MPAEPFDPPQNVTIANANASSITLFWHPPAEPNGIIIHYTVYYSDNNSVTGQVGLVQRTELKWWTEDAAQTIGLFALFFFFTDLLILWFGVLLLLSFFFKQQQVKMDMHAVLPAQH